MRLIDADELVKLLKASTMSNGTLINTNTMLAVVEKMQTAYEPDKVVSELKTDSSVKLYGSQNSDNHMIPVKRAIEIVKQGVVSDDVCERK